jgi:hypothetical protein
VLQERGREGIDLIYSIVAVPRVTDCSQSNMDALAPIAETAISNLRSPIHNPNPQSPIQSSIRNPIVNPQSAIQSAIGNRKYNRHSAIGSRQSIVVT